MPHLYYSRLQLVVASSDHDPEQAELVEVVECQDKSDGPSSICEMKGPLKFKHLGSPRNTVEFNAEVKNCLLFSLYSFLGRSAVPQHKNKGRIRPNMQSRTESELIILYTLGIMNLKFSRCVKVI